MAALVGRSRIYVGVHMPLDVIGGAAGGLLLGELARVIETRWSRWLRSSRIGRV